MEDRRIRMDDGRYRLCSFLSGFKNYDFGQMQRADWLMNIIFKTVQKGESRRYRLG